MSKIKYVFLLFAFLSVSIYCSKSNDVVPKKTNAVTLAAADGGCTCSDQDSSGSYTPSIAVFNINGVTVQKAFFTKVKDVVTVDGRFLWQGANSTGQGALAVISLPIQSGTPLVAGTAFGTCVITEPGAFVNGVFLPTLFTTRSFINQSPGTQMQISFNVQTTQSGGTLYYHFVYQLTPAQ